MSAVVIPIAPARIAVSMIARMRSSSAAFGSRADMPEHRDARLRLAEVAAEVDADALAARACLKYAETRAAGTGVPPSPPIAVVTPFLQLVLGEPVARQHAARLVHHVDPARATRTCRARRSRRVPCSRTRPIFAKRPSLMATSARIHGFPAPSSTRPLRMTTSYQADHLASRDRVTDLHANRARLEMRVEGEATITDVDDHVISAHRLERDGNGARVHTRDVLRNAILHGDDASVRHRERVVPFGEVVLVLETIARVRAVRVVHLHVVDREALRDGRSAAHWNQRAPMPGASRRPVAGQPDATAKWWPDERAHRRHGHERSLELLSARAVARTQFDFYTIPQCLRRRSRIDRDPQVHHGARSSGYFRSLRYWNREPGTSNTLGEHTVREREDDVTIASGEHVDALHRHWLRAEVGDVQLVGEERSILCRAGRRRFWNAQLERRRQNRLCRCDLSGTSDGYERA